MSPPQLDVDGNAGNRYIDKEKKDSHTCPVPENSGWLTFSSTKSILTCTVIKHSLILSEMTLEQDLPV